MEPPEVGCLRLLGAQPSSDKRVWLLSLIRSNSDNGLVSEGLDDWEVPWVQRLEWVKKSGNRNPFRLGSTARVGWGARADLVVLVHSHVLLIVSPKGNLVTGGIDHARHSEACKIPGGGLQGWGTG